ncbi:hypothetical protein HPP92_009360 [Vanilla planifolia]|uniref:Uncharacterized protein n=1 Tax=Vanilla planifolia TaxID=51239 RepID=A0A835R9W2_VANPL|nr:hypothetical protein HPP92_009360 [Vanilla planifolia]
MDPVKLNGTSTDGEPSPEIDLPEEPKQTQFFDLEDDNDEELATPKETDGPDDTMTVLQKEIRALLRDRPQVRRRVVDLMSEMEDSNKGARSLAARTAELEGELSRAKEEFAHASSVAENARADAESLRLAVKILEFDKASLETRIRDFVARMADLDLEKKKAVDEALKKEVELRSVWEESRLDLEKASATSKEKDAELFSLMEQLKECNEESETERDKTKALLLKKEEEAAVLKEELRIAKARTMELEAEKERALPAASTACDDARRLEKELNLSREMSSTEMKSEKRNANLAVLQQEELINSLKEELKVSRERVKELEVEKEKALLLASIAENELTSLIEELKKTGRVSMIEQVIISLREQLEIEKKKAASVLADKESVVAFFNHEPRRNCNDELKVGNSKLDADKEQLRQAMVNTKRKEEEQEREMKHLKDINSELEGKVKELQFQIDGDQLNQNFCKENLAKEEGPNISWVAMAAAAASTGTIAAAITAFCLLKSSHS